MTGCHQAVLRTLTERQRRLIGLLADRPLRLDEVMSRLGTGRNGALATVKSLIGRGIVARGQDWSKRVTYRLTDAWRPDEKISGGPPSA